jgi:DNA-directed RNA polymerase subunit omega
MARVTVEDCLAQIPNRFALTILASRRARALLENRGTAQVKCNNKEAVTALREISANRVRYIESVNGTLVDFIEEQRSKLRASNTDNSYLEAVAFGGIEGDDDGGSEVEELTADLEKLGIPAPESTDDDNNNATNLNAAQSTAEPESALLEGDDAAVDAVAGDDVAGDDVAGDDVAGDDAAGNADSGDAT